MHILPAIDLIDGQCVRLEKGDYARSTVYARDPLDMAKRFEDAGLRRLHLVDLDGAKAGRIVQHRVLERICTRTSLRVDFGGGLRQDEDLRIAFECGAAQVTGGSVAVKRPATFVGWLEQYGPQRIILGADVQDGHIAVSGWQEQSEIELFHFLEKYMALGIQEVVCTDISRDGMLGGPATALYQQILARFPGLKLIASGGISSLDDVLRLREAGLHAAIVGKAIYEGRISLADLAALGEA